MTRCHDCRLDLTTWHAHQGQPVCRGCYGRRQAREVLMAELVADHLRQQLTEARAELARLVAERAVGV
jgi:hypothetical protein